MRFFTITFCFVLLNLHYGISKVIPDQLPKPCSKSVPDYNECTLKYFEEFLPHALIGVRELNIPSFNPYVIPEYTVKNTISTGITMEALMTKIHIFGFDTLKYKSFKFNHETLTSETVVHIDKVHVTMEFEAKGYLFTSEPLEDSGYFTGNLTDVDLAVTISLKPVNKNGVNYFSVNTVDIKGGGADAEVKLISKKPENQRVSDFVANFINKDPKHAMKTLRPVANKHLENLIKLASEKVLETVPADEVIPE